MTSDQTLQALRDLQKTIEQKIADQKILCEENSRRINELQEKIKAGESTGDDVTDYCIVHLQGDVKAEEKLKSYLGTTIKN